MASIVIWVLQSFDTRLMMVSDSSDSMLAGIGRFIAPVFAPLGFGNWISSTALLTGLSAKEAVVVRADGLKVSEDGMDVVLFLRPEASEKRREMK